MRSTERPPRYQRTVLVLQGGGALGAYQVGVFEALTEAGHAPDWFAGTSIGAVNAAIMAGNPPRERVARLDRFWRAVTRHDPWPTPANGLARRAYRSWSAALTAWLGQAGFFRPRLPSPWLAGGGIGTLGHYDVEELRRTLEDLIDFGLINDGGVRLSLGAVNVASGQQVYFDSRHQRLELAHVMASAAFPPAFPAVEIDGEWFWDGGIVSNTPLDVVIDDNPRHDTLVFMVDLFDGRGPLPTSMEEALERKKDITYANRSARGIEAHRTMHDLRRALNAFWERLPPEARADPHLQDLARLRCTTGMNIVHLLYRGSNETAAKDYDFSAESLRERRATGRADALRVLADPHWIEPPPEDVGVVLHGAGPPA